MPRISTNSNEWKFVSFVAERNLNMSQVFFDELELPQPDVNLEVGSGSHAQRTALIMPRFEPVVLDDQPDWVVVPGDVNSTVPCVLVAGKLGVRVAH